jgi:tetratricopeptide (TPR) repeat protein
MSECALSFFNTYLKPDQPSYDNTFFSEADTEYIQAINQDNSCIAALCNVLQANNLDSAARMAEEHKAELFAEEAPVYILARMFIDAKIDLAIWLYNYNVKYHPKSWQAHYNLGYAYKEKGETLMSKNELLKARELNPDNTDIANLLNEIKDIE